MLHTWPSDESQLASEFLRVDLLHLSLPAMRDDCFIVTIWAACYESIVVFWQMLLKKCA